MQAPVMVFDHINKRTAVLVPGPKTDKQLAAVAEAQRRQIATSGRPAK